MKSKKLDNCSMCNEQRNFNIVRKTFTCWNAKCTEYGIRYMLYKGTLITEDDFYVYLKG